MPSNCNYPTAPSFPPSRRIYRGCPGLEAAREGRPAAPAEPFVETLPDQSDEFDGFNVQEDVVNVDLEGGEPPHVSTQKALSRMKPRERDVISRYVLNGGRQIRGGPALIGVVQKRPFSESEKDMDDFVRDLGGDPATIVTGPIVGGTHWTYKDKKAGYTVTRRDLSGRDKKGPGTLEFTIERPGRTKFQVKLRYES